MKPFPVLGPATIPLVEAESRHVMQCTDRWFFKYTSFRLCAALVIQIMAGFCDEKQTTLQSLPRLLQLKLSPFLHCDVPFSFP